MHPTTTRRSALRRTVAMMLLDAVAVVIFCAIGRRSHAEASSLAGLARTAWPFLGGLTAGWLVVALRLRDHLGAGRGLDPLGGTSLLPRRVDPAAVAPAGLIVWAATLVIGMVLRVVSGQGIAVSFVVVAATALAVLLVGPRALWALRGAFRNR